MPERQDSFVTYQQQLDAACLRLFISQARSVGVFGPLLALTVASLFWGTTQRLPALAWAGCLSLMFIARALYFRFRVPDPQAFLEMGFWKTKLCICSICICLVWSASSWFLLDNDTAHLTPYVLLSLAITATGLITIMASSRVIFILSESALLLPAAIMLCRVEDDNMLAIALGLIVFWAGIVMLGLRVGDAAIAGLRTEIENQALVEQLREQKYQLEQASKAKSRFLAAASHDLGQPLYAMKVISNSVLNKASGVDSELKEGFEQSLQSLQNISEGLNEISQLDAGVITPKLEPMVLPQLLSDLRKQFLPLANARGLSLEIEAESEEAYSDPKLLRRLLINLLTNALDYTNEGGVRVSTQTLGNQVEVRIEDSGVGIAEPDLERVFEEFQRLKPEQEGAEGETAGSGLGLGLSISKRIAALIGAKLAVESVQGEGSVFTVTLPTSSSS